MKNILFMLLFSPAVFCQGILLEKGKNSLSGAYNFTGNNISSSNSGAVVFSFSGIVDLGLGYSKSASDDNDVEITSFTPSISYNLRRNENPGGVSFRLAYFFAEAATPEIYYYSYGYHKRESTINISGPVLNISAGISLQNREKFAVLVLFGVTYGFLLSDNTHMDDPRSVSIGMAFRPMTGNLGFLINPGVAIDLNGGDNSTSYGISVGIIFDLTSNME